MEVTINFTFRVEDAADAASEAAQGAVDAADAARLSLSLLQAVLTLQQFIVRTIVCREKRQDVLKHLSCKEKIWLEGCIQNREWMVLLLMECLLPLILSGRQSVVFVLILKSIFWIAQKWVTFHHGSYICLEHFALDQNRNCLSEGRPGNNIKITTYLCSFA